MCRGSPYTLVTPFSSAVYQCHPKDVSSCPVPHTSLNSYIHLAAKRAGEPHPIERTPDSKRPRVAYQPVVETSPKLETPPNPPKLSPVPSHSQTPSQPLSQPLSQQPVTHPPPQPSSSQIHTLPPNFSPAAVHRQNLLNSIRTIEEQLRNLQLSIQNAQSEGNAALLESLKQEFKNKTLFHQKVKHTFVAFSLKMQQQVQLLAAAQNQSQNQSHQARGQAQVQGQETQETQLPVGLAASNTLVAVQSSQPVSSNDAPAPAGRPDQQILAQFMHQRSLSSSSTGLPGAMVPQGGGRVMSAPVAAQMQKLNEQAQRVRPGIQGPGPGSGVGGGQQGQTQSGPPANEGAGKRPVWQGSLTWSGTNPNGGKKEVTVYVEATTLNPSERYVGSGFFVCSPGYRLVLNHFVQPSRHLAKGILAGTRPRRAIAGFATVVGTLQAYHVCI